MPELNQAEKRLVVNTAAQVRKAIVERAELLNGPLAEYDQAVRDDDEDKIMQCSIMLLLMGSSLMDPVNNVLRQYAELSQLLKGTTPDV